MLMIGESCFKADVEEENFITARKHRLLSFGEKEGMRGPKL
jgi:hypothetical protein